MTGCPAVMSIMTYAHPGPLLSESINLCGPAGELSASFRRELLCIGDVADLPRGPPARAPFVQADGSCRCGRHGL